MHVTFRHSLPAQWCASGIVQRASLFLWKRSFLVALHRLLDVTTRGEPVLHVLTWVVGLLWSRHPPYGYVGPCMMSMSDQVGFHPLHCASLLKPFYPLTDLSLKCGACPILCNIRRCISADLTPSAHRKRTTARCSLMMQSLSGAAILLPSLLSAMWLNDGMLSAANYTSSLAHIWCCTWVPLSSFYRAISKLPLLSDSPTYV
jgi:hypothetical protein